MKIWPFFMYGYTAPVVTSHELAPVVLRIQNP
jgi:hypothetical protein